jgi:hypothetical protein
MEINQSGTKTEIKMEKETTSPSSSKDDSDCHFSIYDAEYKEETR